MVPSKLQKEKRSHYFFRATEHGWQLTFHGDDFKQPLRPLHPAILLQWQGWKLLPQPHQFSASFTAKLPGLLPLRVPWWGSQICQTTVLGWAWGLVSESAPVTPVCGPGLSTVAHTQSCCHKFPCLQLALLWHPLWTLPEWSFRKAYRMQVTLLSTMWKTPQDLLLHTGPAASPTLSPQAPPALVSHTSASASGPEHWLISCSEMLSAVYLFGRESSLWSLSWHPNPQPPIMLSKHRCPVSRWSVWFCCWTLTIIRHFLEQGVCLTCLCIPQT